MVMIRSNDLSKTPSLREIQRAADRLWRLPNRAHVIAKAGERIRAGRDGRYDRAVAAAAVGWKVGT